VSVLVLVSNHEEAPTLVRWGVHFSRSRHLGLRVVVPRPATNARAATVVDLENATDDDDVVVKAVRETLTPFFAEFAKEEEADGEQEVHPPFAPELRVLAGPNAFDAVLKELTDASATLLIIGKHRKMSKGEKGYQLIQSLFRRAPCDTLLIRPGEHAAESCKHVLVPAAGGPHAIAALKWAADLAMEYDGHVTPLYVVPPHGNHADDVGNAHLDDILTEAGAVRSEWMRPKVAIANKPIKAIAEEAETGYDLVLIGGSEKGSLRRALFGTLPMSLLAGPDPLAIGVMRRARPLTTRVRDHLEDWFDMRVPQLARQERIALFDRLESGSRWDFDFLALMSLATVIAALGLIQNSTAVVIGAMLVAPLMTPLIASGLALVQGNLRLMRQALRSVGYGFVLAVGIGMLSGLCAPVHELTSELAARGSPNLLDLGIAFFSGVAAAYALARPGLSAALPGVAIAAALVPPLATVGISLAFGETANALGAALLFATNIIVIVLGAAFAFHACGVHGSMENGRSILWSRRATLLLIVVAAGLAVPLASVVVSRAIEHYSAIHITTELEQELEDTLAQEAGADLIATHIMMRQEPPVIQFTIQAPNTPAQSTIDELASHLSKALETQVRVRIVTHLIQESQPATEAP
jgi:uncharacterized hydrophobic protein (TIGR00271 family)